MNTCGLATGVVAALLMLCLPACSDQAWSLRNGHFDLRGRGCTITHIAFDARGKGRYSANLVRSVTFHGVVAPTTAHAAVQGSRVVVTGCQGAEPFALGNEKANRPDMLLPGHTLGQSFRVEGGAFTEVSVKLPTWGATGSAATLVLRRGGPQGEVVVTRRADNVDDNSWQTLAFDPQPAGEYLIEISDPKGSIGWWTHTDDRLANGQPYADGAPLAQGDRTIRVTGERLLGDTTFEAGLSGNRLSLSVSLRTEIGWPRGFPLHWVLPWKRDGYDVSKDSVPFSRFFTDRQRYMPIEQLKRSDIGMHLTLDGAKWLEAEGTDSYDLRLEANGLWFDADTEPEDLILRFRTREYRTLDGLDQTGFTLTVLPRCDTIPREWPAFETPDPALTRDLNRLFYERAFTYPGAPGPAPWLEWTALMRFWHGGPAHEDAVAQLPAIVIDHEGYVHTWGGERGWPFPDPKTYDTRHFDTNARFILSCWRYVCWTHDTEFLRSQAERLRRAMNYQLTTLKGGDGLIVAASKDVTGKHRGVGNNYWDILPFGHLDAYANAVYYASLEAMAQIEEFLDAAGGADTPSPRRSPAQYRRLAQRTKEAYNRAFWDQERGRYIGCIDSDGKRHDYGFTFVNLEAMAYGLASEGQGRRIYRWMETEPTSTGQPDTYSAYVFAPRANTIHNPMWDPQTGASKESGPTEPWWHFGWPGTPYGNVQCQDGGAILYTSFFDLMARTKLLGVDNAWQRWTEILTRYREPDRLCGGGPLYRGENPQRVNPGAIGVDIPFPESGLVPTWFVYGVAGLNPTVNGLEIKPNLPHALPKLAIRNVQYRGLTLDVRVTRTSVQLTSKTPGHRFTWEETFPDGQGCRLVEPPTGGFPEKPTSPEWIWASPAAEEQETVYLRRTFDLPAKPLRAEIVIAVDNSYALYVNGIEAGKGEGWSAAARWDLTTFLRKGRNVIAVEAHNAGGPAGVVARLTAKVAGKTIRIDSNVSWRASRQAPSDWTQPAFDDSTWDLAASLGSPPVGPWGAVKLE